MKALIATAGLLMGLSAGTTLQAATLTSSMFSVGLGFNSGSWGFNETLNDNEWPSGDFDVDVNLVGGEFSPSGVGFSGRTIGNGFNSGSGYPGDGSQSFPFFEANITGAYVGAAPADAAANPNYQIELNVTAIKIYATQHSGASDTLNFTETTAGNTHAQSPQTINFIAGISDPGSYQQISWDPAEFLSAMGMLSQARSFGLSSGSSNGLTALDGFEVFGNVTLDYDAVPEPAIMSLLVPVVTLLPRRRS